jgi:hypothetical protein
VDQADRSDPAAGEVAQHRHRALDRLAALDAGQRRDLPVAPGLADVVAGQAEDQLALVLVGGGGEGVDLAVHRGGAAALRIGPGPHAEHLRPDPALAHARQVDVAEVADLARAAPLVALGDVVAEPVHQLGGVGVEVEDQDLVVEQARLFERERHGHSGTSGERGGTGAGCQRPRTASSTASAESTRLNGGMM